MFTLSYSMRHYSHSWSEDTRDCIVVIIPAYGSSPAYVDLMTNSDSERNVSYGIQVKTSRTVVTTN